ncbi:hypothetical protein SDC9_124640 [bioreactor metagenome]|uniref:Uncharacterized protein n=1 Tax=bioreactor metagenome TaxID=1076179 RepID=A0A645CL25_9ZZZZ
MRAFIYGREDGHGRGLGVVGGLAQAGDVVGETAARMRGQGARPAGDAKALDVPRRLGVCMIEQPCMGLRERLGLRQYVVQHTNLARGCGVRGLARQQPGQGGGNVRDAR